MRLAAEPLAGQTRLVLAERPAGWQAGDRLVLPDTRQLGGDERGSRYQPQWEELTVAAVVRTPLNSMLILSKMLAENPDSHLSDKQVEFANTIHSSGADLLALINEILDLSKIESGTMAVEIADVTFTDLRSDIKRMFSQVAEDKGLDLVIELQEGLPDRVQTDVKRLRQVLKNLLSNAFKFTEFGEVNVQVGVATSGWNTENAKLNRQARSFHLACRIRVSAFRRTSSSSSLRRFNRPTEPQAANMAERVLAFRSAARSLDCSAVS